MLFLAPFNYSRRAAGRRRRMDFNLTGESDYGVRSLHKRQWDIRP
jgi:hypothetical protein